MSKPKRRSLVLQLKNLTQPKMDENTPKSPLSPGTKKIVVKNSGSFQTFISTFSSPSQPPPPEKMKAEVEKLEPQNKERKKEVLVHMELLKEDFLLYQEIVDAGILLYRKKLRDLENTLEKSNDNESLESQYNSTIEMKNILSKGMDEKRIKKVVTNLKNVTETFGDWRDEISYENIKCRQTIVMKSTEDFHINACCFSMDSNYICIGLTGQNSLQIYSAHTGRYVKGYNNLTEVHSLCVSVDGKYIFAGSISTVGIWNLQTFEFVKTLTGHSKIVSALEVTPDGKYLISGDKNSNDDSHVIVWDLQTFDVYTQIDQLGKNSNDDSHVIVWDLQTFDVYTQIDQLGKVKSINSLKDSKSFLVETESLSNPTYIMRYQPNGEKLNHIKVDKIVSGVLVHNQEIIYGESSPPEEPGLSTLNLLTVTGRIDNESIEKAYVDLGTADIEKLAKNEKGNYFATSSKSDTDVKIWSKDGKEIACLEGHKAKISDVQFSYDSTLIATVSMDGNKEGEFDESNYATLKIWH
eukprot:gene8082-12543_t